MSDLIDRQALLKQIDIDSDGEPGYYGDTWKFIDTIKSMPPATQLSTNLAEVGTDCISRQAAIDALDEQIAQCNKAIKSFVLSMKDEYAAKVEKASLTAFRERLEYLPPAQPEIVRCKDCNHFYKDNLNQWCFLGKYGVKENGFCSRAERRTNERSD